jgi:hypothetical protein
VKKESKKKFQVNDLEADWGGFLVDADAVAALPFFDRAAKATAHDDPDIVREAWDQRRTIVTSNGRDFLRYIQEFQNPPNNPSCKDLWGIAGNSKCSACPRKRVGSCAARFNRSAERAASLAGSSSPESLCALDRRWTN